MAGVYELCQCDPYRMGGSTMKQHMVIGAILAAILLGACGTASHPSIDQTTGSASGPSLKTDTIPKFAASSLLLPNGTVLSTSSEAEATRWKDIEIHLLMTAVPPAHPYGQAVVGNHSQILSQEFISTPNGQAWFALNERTPPAAEQSGNATYEYWVAIERTSASTRYNIDYCIEAVVTGSRSEARAEVLQLLAGWKVPPTADVPG
jgi:hypothetical protein